jgi:hypothetical protein
MHTSKTQTLSTLSTSLCLSVSASAASIYLTATAPPPPPNLHISTSQLVFTDEQKETFNTYVVSTRIRAARNISGFSLPTGATDEDRAGV